MVVSGVRRSWDTARSRFARILSFSLSDFKASCCFNFVVNALVRIDTTTITMPEIKFTGAMKSIAK